MKKAPSEVLERIRDLTGEMEVYGVSGVGSMSGCFAFAKRSTNPRQGASVLRIISSEGDGQYPWEHVSVSVKDRCPTWSEMCLVKDLFWEPEETVLQYHPPLSEYVNQHPFTLHLWRPILLTIPLPPSELVGFTKKEPVR